LPLYSYEAGELVLIRARILTRCSDCFSRHAVAAIVIGDRPDGRFLVNTFAPFDEIARPDDVARLLQAVTIDPTTAFRSPLR
jgi:alkylhydroperoxidase family enzyme